MARSLKKGPYVEESLQKKIDKMNENNEKKVVKTWSRASMISPDMLGHTIAVHNGKTHVPVCNCPSGSPVTGKFRTFPKFLTPC